MRWRGTRLISHFAFVAISGRLVEVENPEKKKIIKHMFLDLIKSRGLSPHVMSALGHSSNEPPEVLLGEERNSVWKLVDVNVKEITGLRNSEKSEAMEA